MREILAVPGRFETTADGHIRLLSYMLVSQTAWRRAFPTPRSGAPWQAHHPLVPAFIEDDLWSLPVCICPDCVAATRFRQPGLLCLELRSTLGTDRAHLWVEGVADYFDSRDGLPFGTTLDTFLAIVSLVHAPAWKKDAGFFALVPYIRSMHV